jgi:hypothetical protein
MIHTGTQENTTMNAKTKLTGEGKLSSLPVEFGIPGSPVLPSTLKDFETHAIVLEPAGAGMESRQIRHRFRRQKLLEAHLHKNIQDLETALCCDEDAKPETLEGKSKTPETTHIASNDDAELRSPTTQNSFQDLIQDFEVEDNNRLSYLSHHEISTVAWVGIGYHGYTPTLASGKGLQAVNRFSVASNTSDDVQATLQPIADMKDLDHIAELATQAYTCGEALRPYTSEISASIGLIGAAVNHTVDKIKLAGVKNLRNMIRRK